MQEDQVGSSQRNRRTKERIKSERSKGKRKKKEKKTDKVTNLAVYSFQFAGDCPWYDPKSRLALVDRGELVRLLPL